MIIWGYGKEQYKQDIKVFYHMLLGYCLWYTTISDVYLFK